VRGGYLTLGRWRGAPVRAHWTLPIGAMLFGQGRFVPGFWLGFFMLVLVHEVGHALLVRRYGQRVVSIDVHGLGGACRWSGDPTAIDRARIAWGGVLAQAALLVGSHLALAFFGAPETAFAAQLATAFTTTNLWLIGINLIPVPPLDGAEAWKLPGLLARHRATGQGGPSLTGSAPGAGFEREREMATLDRFSGEPDEGVRTAVEDALERLRDETKTPRN